MKRDKERSKEGNKERNKERIRREIGGSSQVVAIEGIGGGKG
jgi:hypothetical protein